MTIRFQDDAGDVLRAAAARARRASTGHGDLGFETLSAPHPDSPFLTLAEWQTPGRETLPVRVVKVLVVLEEDPSAPFWHEVLERERDRWRRELRQRLALPARVATLGLPLSAVAVGSDALVEIGTIGPLRRSDVLREESEEQNVRFSYLVRPYIAWPRLADVGYSTEQLMERWEIYCQEHAVAEHLSERLFPHFCAEALTDERRDLLLSSAWRLEMFRS